MLMTLIRSRLQGRELKPFNCVQVQDNLRFIDSHLKETRTSVFCSYVHSMNHMYAYSRYNRKIKFRLVSAQHFINEAPGVRAGDSAHHEGASRGRCERGVELRPLHHG